MAARVAVTTINASCGGTLLAFLYSLWLHGQYRVEFVTTGILGALVAITGAQPARAIKSASWPCTACTLNATGYSLVTLSIAA